MKTKRDETLEEIWAIRRRIAKQFGDDPLKRVAYYQRKQKESGARIYRPEIPIGTDLRTEDALHDRPHAKVAAGKTAPLKSYRAASKRQANRAK